MVLLSIVAAGIVVNIGPGPKGQGHSQIWGPKLQAVCGEEHVNDLFEAVIEDQNLFRNSERLSQKPRSALQDLSKLKFSKPPSEYLYFDSIAKYHSLTLG